jgi:hypothetical protein
MEAARIEVLSDVTTQGLIGLAYIAEEYYALPEADPMPLGRADYPIGIPPQSF